MYSASCGRRVPLSASTRYRYSSCPNDIKHASRPQPRAYRPHSLPYTGWVASGLRAKYSGKTFCGAKAQPTGKVSPTTNSCGNAPNSSTERICKGER
jgi:hypothetical protein